MKKLFVDGWKFWESEFGTEYETAVRHLNDFVPVEIPHDYLISDTRGLYRDSTGWYTRDFECQAKDLSKKLFLIFDGIYMDSIVYVNGKAAGEWKYGYSQFVLEITDYVKEGVNTLMVAARCKFPNTRWYSGAGIYRNVWLCDYETTYIPENGIYVHTQKAEGGYYLYVNTEVCGKEADNVKVNTRLFYNGAGNVFFKKPSAPIECNMSERPLSELFAGSGDSSEPGKICNLPQKVNTKYIEQLFFIENVKEWDVSITNSYILEQRLEVRCDQDKKMDHLGENSLDAAEGVIQTEKINIGFRDVKMDADKGFFLNGNHMKLNGVCLHHDLGALGSAYNNTAMRRRLIQLKEMGVNAIRLTHNMYDPGVIGLADEMGFLLISEAFDMWEGRKTEFDYARFFPKWHAKDVASWVRRDRNHPSVILWSIGNEIYDTHASERGQEVTLDLKTLVELHDPLKNARATIGSNYMPWEMAQKCADILKVAGYNYAESYYETHHKEHPDWVIYGSETYSIVQSRGVYHFPLSVPILSDTDEQCSSLGNSTTSWGADSIENCICKDRDMEFSLGQFVWTGYDYIGEPTPYHTKNSYFGLIDTAGFYKDAFYAWKSAWTSYVNDPFVHVFPYWDFNEGQIIDVRVCSNAPEVELFVNGKSLGKQKLSHDIGSGNHIFADYRVPYEKGEIKAVCYDENGKQIATDIHKSFGDTDSFVVDIDKRLLDYGAKDLVFAEISALDKDKNPVENASDYVQVVVSGNGELIGLDNGDSTDYDSYQSDCRKLFNGKLLAIVKCTGNPESIIIEVKKAKKVPVRAIKMTVCEENTIGADSENILEKYGRVLTKEHSHIRVRAQVFPSDCTDKDITFRALNKNGTDTNVVEISQDGEYCDITALGDGEFFLRCEAKSGRDIVTTMSVLEFEVRGIGTAYLDPYGFIAGSLYKSYVGNVGSGNEYGVATARGQQTIITYSGIDFGKDGSDEITIPIFALNDEEYKLEVWSGIPDEEGAELLLNGRYQKKSIWNVYQEDTWKLSKRLTGIQTISLRLFDKIHIKGFSFTKESRAFADTRALDADSVYGDTFTKTKDAVEGIGNNVTLEFKDFDLGEDGSDRIVICGRGNALTNTIHLRMKNSENGEVKEILEFPNSTDYSEVSFEIEKKKGHWDMSFVFLPGSNFDFKSFRFEK